MNIEIEEKINLLKDKLEEKGILTQNIPLLERWIETKKFEVIEEIYCCFEKSLLDGCFDGIDGQANIYYLFGLTLYEITKSNIYPPKESNQLNLLSINLYVMIADYFESIGCVGEAFDTLIRSIEPDYKFESRQRELQVEFKLSIFQDGVNFGFLRAREILLYYSSIYFKVSSILGHTLNEALSHFIQTNHFLNLVNPTKFDIDYWCNASKVHYYLKNKPVLELITLQFKILLKGELLKGNFDTYTKFDIIENLLVYHSDNLSNSEILTLFNEINSINLTGTINIRKNALELWRSIKNKDLYDWIIRGHLYQLVSSINFYYPNILLGKLQRQRLSWIINEVIISLINLERYSLAFECSYIWKVSTGQSVDLNFKEDELIILIISNYEANKIYYLIQHKQETKLFSFDTSKNHSDIIEYKNKIESTWIAKLEETNTHEIVNVDVSPDTTRDTSLNYFENLTNFYSTQELVEKINEYDDIKRIRLFELSTMNTPIQSMMAQKTNKEISLLGSNKNKRASKIKKILFWIDPDCSLYIAEYEYKSLLRIVKSSGISEENIVLRYQQECTKEDFIRFYDDNTFDLIWISGHASFDANDPRNSHINISQDEKLYLYELSENKLNRKQRRLLVLNLCQSGASYIRYNGMDFNSIVSFLTNRFQSTIGHLWLTNYLASSTIGAILMSYLTQGNSWAEAVNNTQRLMYSGKESILAELQDNYGDLELLDRIRNQESVELELMAYWGSLVFSE